MPAKKPPEGFLGLPEENRDPRTARVVVLPIPFEATVSYESGTREGPAAIITASRQVELYDEELESEPALGWGVQTLPPLACELPAGEAMTERIARAVAPVVKAGRLLLALGGEHGISAGIVRGVRRAFPDPLTIVQIDAHADLRDSYEGDRFSHACAMRRILDENPGEIVQLGIRSFSIEEAQFIRANRGRVNMFTAGRIRETDHLDFLRVLAELVKGRNIYLTIDVDGLDPSVVPATGTPEPGGLSWREALDIVKTVAEASRIVAMDCVELAPRPGLHMAEFAVAKLLYKSLAYAIRT
ncbi:MAG: agmatinase [Spirochaetes bacterium]|nr:agmatinase [Spirochaetota bacterium]